MNPSGNEVIARTKTGSPWATAICSVLIIMGAIVLPSSGASAGDSPGQIRQLREEIHRLREENQRTQQRMEELERKLKEVEAQQGQAVATQEQQMEERATTVSRRYLDRYWGENRFVLTGWGAGTFAWRRNAATNTFTATLAPIFLYRVTDRILFEAEPEFELADDGETEVNLEYAQADVFLNDYVTVVGGKFLLPFGEFIQQLHPAWINKLVSFPLPLRENEEGGLLPFSNVGLQLRGGARLFDRTGLNLDYTVFIANGPRFESDEVGSLLNPNNVDNNRGKGYGARLAVYPLPLDFGMGRLKLGASTFDGKWGDGGDLWFTSWGLDLAYQLEEFELRGEYLRTRREMPSGTSNDDREGWYVQAAYKLARLQVPHLNRLELVARYSGLNQRAVTEEDLLPHPRQVALGIDYWLTPSVVWKLEYDRDLPKDAPNDHAILTQIGVGF